MSIKYIGTMTAAMLLLLSCSKEISVKDVDFEVSIDKTDYIKNEAVNFNFTGEADMISFYSGLPGRNYEYRQRTTADGKPELSFTTVKNSGAQVNSLSLMVSSDFKGVVNGNDTETAANIDAATWKDITSRAKLATSTTALASGDIDLSDIANENKKVYIAFKYTGVKGAIMNKWTITKLVLTNTLPDGSTYTIANLNANATEILNYEIITYSPGWIGSVVKGTYKFAITAGTSLVIAGATSVANSTADAESWAVMGLLDLKKVSPDKGEQIKKQSEDMSAFPYVFNYEEAGNYNPTFVGTNSSRDGQNQRVKTLNLSVK